KAIRALDRSPRPFERRRFRQRPHGAAEGPGGAGPLQRCYGIRRLEVDEEATRINRCIALALVLRYPPGRRTRAAAAASVASAEPDAVDAPVTGSAALGAQVDLGRGGTLAPVRPAGGRC